MSIYIQLRNRSIFYFNMCNKGIVIVLGTADKAILIQIGRCNIKAAPKRYILWSPTFLPQLFRFGSILPPIIEPSAERPSVLFFGGSRCFLSASTKSQKGKACNNQEQLMPHFHRDFLLVPSLFIAASMSCTIRTILPAPTADRSGCSGRCRFRHKNYAVYPCGR